jgi:hypothetical protein
MILQRALRMEMGKSNVSEHGLGAPYRIEHFRLGCGGIAR